MQLKKFQVGVLKWAAAHCMLNNILNDEVHCTTTKFIHLLCVAIYVSFPIILSLNLDKIESYQFKNSIQKYIDYTLESFIQFS